MKYLNVRVWPNAEWGEPLIHLMESGHEVIGLTLCGQPVRNAMKETPVTDLIGLKRCSLCEEKREP